MAALDFPASPTLNQTYTANGGTWRWDGTSWVGGNTLTVPYGGTGAASLTANNVLLGNGTSAVQVVAPGTSGNVLTSNGTTWTSAAAPTTGWTQIATTTISGTAANVTFSSIPQTYSDLLLKVDGASHNSSSTQTLDVYASVNNGTTIDGMNYTSGYPIDNLTNMFGGLVIFGYRNNAGPMAGSLNSDETAYGIGRSTNPAAYFTLSAALNWLRVAFSGGSIDAGTFTLYGR